MIMTKVSEYENIDLGKVFAIGASNGSALVNELGINVDFLRGIGPIASQLLLNQSPSKSIESLSVYQVCLLYTSPSPRDRTRSRMPSSA